MALPRGTALAGPRHFLGKSCVKSGRCPGGALDYLRVESTGLSEPLLGPEPRLGRRTVLTFPLLPPPQKNLLALPGYTRQYPRWSEHRPQRRRKRGITQRRAGGLQHACASTPREIRYLHSHTTRRRTHRGGSCTSSTDDVSSTTSTRIPSRRGRSLSCDPKLFTCHTASSPGAGIASATCTASTTSLKCYGSSPCTVSLK
jgi:hypothetical protein